MSDWKYNIMHKYIDAVIDKYGSKILAVWCGVAMHNDLSNILKCENITQKNHQWFVYRDIIFRVADPIRHESMIFLLENNEPIIIHITKDFCIHQDTSKIKEVIHCVHSEITPYGELRADNYINI